MSQEGNHQHGGHKIRIHIDRKPYESENPTIGKSLYILGEVPAHRELFKEASGNHEDLLIPKDDHKVHLTEDEHFYSAKEIEIIVNARKKETVETKLSFDEVVKLAYESPPAGANVLFTITYRNGPKENPEGTLTAGHSVRIKKGMVFNVTPTDKS
jgi:hypothetical protein